jgi:hypothetical protein
MDFISMSDGQLMRLLDMDARLVRRWKSGERDVPPDVAAWFERLVKYWEANPPPIIRSRARGNLENTY